MASIFVKNQTQASSSQNLESFLSRFALYVSPREIPWKHHACKRSCRPIHKQTPSESRSSLSSSSSAATSTSRDTLGGVAAAAAMTSERFAGWGGGRRRIRSGVFLQGSWIVKQMSQIKGASLVTHLKSIISIGRTT